MPIFGSKSSYNKYRQSFGSATGPLHPIRGEIEHLIEAATETSNGYALGGDFAGLAATFDPGNGSFIPVPPHLVPEALVEWGQEPKCLEILVSEEILSDRPGSEESIMKRSTITVLPATGCGIDNLETVKVEDDVDLKSEWGRYTNVVGLQYQIGKEAIRLETIFGCLDEGGNYRMRVAIDLIPSESVFAIQSPMVLALERRTSAIGTGGAIADGGGLDGRTVSMLLGEKLRKSKTFVDDKPLEPNFSSEGIQNVSFPGNVSIAYGWLTDEEWVLQVSHVQNGIRRVVSREFTSHDEVSELDFDVKSWEEEVEATEGA